MGKGRIFKDLSKARKPRMALGDAKLVVNGCRVLLGHTDPIRAQQTAAEFKKMMELTLARAKCPNIGDMYEAQFQMIERIKAGETVAEIIGDEK